MSMWNSAGAPLLMYKGFHYTDRGHIYHGSLEKLSINVSHVFLLVRKVFEEDEAHIIGKKLWHLHLAELIGARFSLPRINFSLFSSLDSLQHV